MISYEIKTASLICSCMVSVTDIRPISIFYYPPQIDFSCETSLQMNFNFILCFDFIMMCIKFI